MSIQYEKGMLNDVFVKYPDSYWRIEMVPRD